MSGESESWKSTKGMEAKLTAISILGIELERSKFDEGFSGQVLTETETKEPEIGACTLYYPPGHVFAHTIAPLVC